MIGRLAWSFALALIAVVAVLAQVDREARRDPAFAALVPDPWSGFAAQRRAEAAIAAEDPAQAAKQTALLISARPLPAEHLRLLSQAAALGGDTPRSLAALEAASKRGWRDPVTQLAAAQSALAQANHEAAGQRIVALLSTGSAPEPTFALLAQYLDVPEGRVIFARKMAVAGHWQANMLGPAAGSVAPMPLAQTIMLAQHEGAALPCDRLERLAQTFAQAGAQEAADLIWPGQCA